jgi:hypothetical protein
VTYVVAGFSPRSLRKWLDIRIRTRAEARDYIQQHLRFTETLPRSYFRFMTSTRCQIYAPAR